MNRSSLDERDVRCDLFGGPMMAGDVTPPDAGMDSRWQTRQEFWRRKLGRLRLGVEPLEDQLARYRRVTWALTLVPTFLAVFFLALFTAFSRPDIGLVLDAILLLPIVAGAWLDYALLAKRADRYLAELREHHQEPKRLPACGDQKETTSESA
jgi:hypothetical protein